MRKTKDTRHPEDDQGIPCQTVGDNVSAKNCIMQSKHIAFFFDDNLA